MRLPKTDKATAQARCDQIHADMIANDPLYAASAALYDPANPGKGGTARWCFVYQDLDGNGNPKSSTWYVTVQERCKGVLNAAEIAQVPEFVAEMQAIK